MNRESQHLGPIYTMQRISAVIALFLGVYLVYSNLTREPEPVQEVPVSQPVTVGRVMWGEANNA